MEMYLGREIKQDGQDNNLLNFEFASIYALTWRLLDSSIKTKASSP